jgi:outer membrane protein OmpA-like peptidoglycan-associated protein
VFAGPVGASALPIPSPANTRTSAGAPNGDARVVRLYFEVGSAELPLDALTRLAPLIMANDTAVFVVSGFHDSSGDAAANAELAKRRAMAVGTLLSQSGIASDRIELRKPAVTTGGTDPREARRVDVSVR